jgi:hypothetical protein
MTFVNVSRRQVLARDNDPSRALCFVSRKSAIEHIDKLGLTNLEAVLLPTTEPIVLGETRFMNMYYIAIC